MKTRPFKKKKITFEARVVRRRLCYFVLLKTVFGFHSTSYITSSSSSYIGCWSLFSVMRNNHTIMLWQCITQYKHTNTTQTNIMMTVNLIVHACSWPISAVGPLCSVASPLLLVQLNKAESEHLLWKKLLLCYTSAEVIFYLWFKHKLRTAQGHHKPQLSTKQRRKEIWDGMWVCGYVGGFLLPLVQINSSIFAFVSSFRPFLWTNFLFTSLHCTLCSVLLCTCTCTYMHYIILYYRYKNMQQQ